MYRIMTNTYFASWSGNSREQQNMRQQLLSKTNALNLLQITFINLLCPLYYSNRTVYHELTLYIIKNVRFWQLPRLCVLYCIGLCIPVIIITLQQRESLGLVLPANT